MQQSEAEKTKPANDSECWKIINQAIAAPAKYEDIWNEEVITAYVTLSSNDKRLKAQALLEPAIKKFKNVRCSIFVKALNDAARAKKKEDMEGSSKLSNFPALDNDKQVWCGQYDCTESGVYLDEQCICNHPIYISQLIQPIDETGTAHVQLSYYINAQWQSVIRPRRTIYDKRRLLELSELGIDITSENSSELIQYFRTLEGWSGPQGREIAKVFGFSRFGWCCDKFLPYSDEALFTGVAEYASVYKAFGEKGDFNKWLEVVKPFYAPDTNPAVRMALAAATASVLLGYIDGGLPFFVHFYGASGHGKTLTLKLVASMFGDPNMMGGLIQSFSSTQVGLERRAEVLNNVPMLLDELGVKGGGSEREIGELVYQLTEGIGKTRGAREGGIQRMMKWLCVFISTGEQALTSFTSQAGVINRIISVDVNGKEIFGDVQSATAVLNVIGNNYGAAGKLITAYIADLGRDTVRIMQNAALDELKKLKIDGMNKQLASASFLAAADDINRVMFEVEGSEGREWLISSIATADEVNVLKRVLEWLPSWRTEYGQYFFENANAAASVVGGNSLNVWGFKRTDGLWAYPVSRFRTGVEKEGYHYTAFISEAKAGGKLLLDANGKTTVPCRIGNQIVRCVIVNAQPEEVEYEEPKSAKVPLRNGSG